MLIAYFILLPDAGLLAVTSREHKVINNISKKFLFF